MKNMRKPTFGVRVGTGLLFLRLFLLGVRRSVGLHPSFLHLSISAIDGSRLLWLSTEQGQYRHSGIGETIK
jgi:hypothetical protein